MSIFEIPEWDADVHKNGVNFQLSKLVKKNNKKRNKNAKKSIDDSEDYEAGKYVRLLKANNDYNGNNPKTKTKKCKNKKRVHELDEKESSPPTKKKHIQVRLNEKGSLGSESINIDDKKVDTAKPLNAWACNLVDDLKASRFRFINEQLYSTTSDKARDAFDDPEAFTTYHEGYQCQVQKWPMNPLDRMIRSIKKLPNTHVIADFGCGEAKLSKSVVNKVYSLDLVAMSEDVIVGDMSNTPLKNDCVDVAVFCLSLMGTNLKDFILEANRVLKMGGILKIAEVQSRFDNVKIFNKNVAKCGFELIYNDWSNKVFYFIHFKKIKNVSKTESVENFNLNPCLYKKR